ncbi:MAG TPA: flippase [Roseiflexaceae bacterium]|nr:flippase [Roseiflexaceae bacterium]
MSTFSRTVVRNSAFGLAAQLAIKLLSFGFSVLIIRNLGAYEFGQYAAVLAFGAMFVFIADLGLSPYTVREIARLRDAPDSAERAAALFGNVLLLRFVLSLVAAVLLIGSAWLTGRPTVMVVAIALGTLGLVMYSLQGTCESVLAGFERLDLTSGSKVLYQLIFVVVGGAMLLLGVGYYGLIVANLLGILLMTYVCWRGVRMIGTLPGRAAPQGWLRLLRATIPFGVIGFTLGLSYKFDTVLLDIFRSPEETGYYNAAYSLVFSTVMLSNVINSALYPSLSRQAGSDAASLGPIYGRTLRYLLVLALPIAAGAWSLADQIVPFLYEKDYLPAVPALQIVIWAVPLLFTSEFLGYVVLVSGHERLVARSVIVSTSFNVLLNLLLVPRYGFMAAAAMTVLTELVLVSQYSWLLRDRLRGLDWGRALLRPLLAAALMAALVLGLKPYLPLLLTVALGAAAYGGALLALGVVGREELHFVRNFRKPQPAVGSEV